MWNQWGDDVAKVNHISDLHLMFVTLICLSIILMSNLSQYTRTSACWQFEVARCSINTELNSVEHSRMAWMKKISLSCGLVFTSAIN